MSVLDQLREMTVIVEDTGDIDSIRRDKPRDATTNPSLLLAAAQLPQYQHLVDDAVAWGGVDVSDLQADMGPCLERLAVNFATEILSIIPGRVSVEVDATLSFDTAATVDAARRLIAMFADQQIDRSRILIKIASTWEGIAAARQLEGEGIHCNLTLLFSFAQAVVCAEAGVTLISPFVGRILDWHKAARGVDSIPPAEDPGVLSVAHIFNYYKRFGYDTEIMGASFRNTGEIIELAGCDLLTISPKLLAELDANDDHLERKLCPDHARKLHLEQTKLDEKTFRWMMNEDAMATEKLAEGIRRFSADLAKLAEYMRQKHNAAQPAK
ncbi:MAG: transaldolase [Phycisphaerae bacterium]|jgi:transaldolase|nr:transaldolase [Phycisphaerae bacterium]